MSRRLKRQLGKTQGGRGVKPSPGRRARTRSPEARMNRLLLLGAGGLAIGAVVLALVSRPFNPIALGTNLVAIGVGLLMGKGIGRFIFRRLLTTAGK